MNARCMCGLQHLAIVVCPATSGSLLRSFLQRQSNNILSVRKCTTKKSSCIAAVGWHMKRISKISKCKVRLHLPDSWICQLVKKRQKEVRKCMSSAYPMPTCQYGKSPPMTPNFWYYSTSYIRFEVSIQPGAFDMNFGWISNLVFLVTSSLRRDHKSLEATGDCAWDCMIKNSLLSRIVRTKIRSAFCPRNETEILRRYQLNVVASPIHWGGRHPTLLAGGSHWARPPCRFTGFMWSSSLSELPDAGTICQVDLDPHREFQMGRC